MEDRRRIMKLKPDENLSRHLKQSLSAFQHISMASFPPHSFLPARKPIGFRFVSAGIMS